MTKDDRLAREIVAVWKSELESTDFDFLRKMNILANMMVLVAGAEVRRQRIPQSRRRQALIEAQATVNRLIEHYQALVLKS